MTALTYYDANGRELVVAGTPENGILRLNGTFELTEHLATDVAYEILMLAGPMEPEVAIALEHLKNLSDRKEAQSQ